MFSNSKLSVYFITIEVEYTLNLNNQKRRKDMKKILIINTGGTFNKVYNPLTGNLEIDKQGEAIKSIAKAWLTEFKIKNIIGKDSLQMTKKDRNLIVKTIKETEIKDIIIVHGTDTMHKTAKRVAKAKIDKNIILTGSMVPFSINPIESTSNLCSAYGFIQDIYKGGVYISMNGIIKDYKKVFKNKEKGYFEESK
jgi:L-asparaginase